MTHTQPWITRAAVTHYIHTRSSQDNGIPLFCAQCFLHCETSWLSGSSFLRCAARKLGSISMSASEGYFCATTGTLSKLISLSLCRWAPAHSRRMTVTRRAFIVTADIFMPSQGFSWSAGNTEEKGPSAIVELAPPFHPGGDTYAMVSSIANQRQTVSCWQM